MINASLCGNLARALRIVGQMWRDFRSKLESRTSCVTTPQVSTALPYDDIQSTSVHFMCIRLSRPVLMTSLHARPRFDCSFGPWIPTLYGLIGWMTQKCRVVVHEQKTAFLCFFVFFCFFLPRGHHLFSVLSHVRSTPRIKSSDNMNGAANLFHDI